MRTWTIKPSYKGDIPAHTISCDEYEIGTVFARQDLLQFIVDACNEKERREHGVNEWAEEERMPPKAWAANAMAHLKKVIE